MGYSETTISQHRRLLLVLGIVLFTSLAMHTATARNDSAKLGPLVQQLADEYDRAGRGATTQFAKKRGIRIRELQDGACIPVILEPTAKNRARFLPQQRLCDLGCTVDAVSTSYVRLLVPPRALRHLEGHPGVHIARAPFQAVELLGPNLSESVELTAADAMHTAGFTGDGVKVGVVDLGFIGLAARISDGELPANTVMVDLPGTNDDIPESNTEHGVGVSEHVTDMAPDAQVFCFMALDSVDLQNAADYARDNGISVINHSVGWVNVSYYDDTGRINDIINTSFDTDGVFWTVSAGNSAFRHWRGVWTDDDVDNRLDFALNDDALAITSSSSNVRLFLNWDQYGASLTDLDFYVFDKDDNQVAQSIAPQTGPHSPTERINFTYDPVLAPYYIEVQWFSGPTAGLDVTIFSFDNNIEHPVPAAALMDPADAHGAYTIAAIYQGYWNQPSPPRESFSSEGPTTDGRQKPDISAPDGTTSKTYGITGSFGTSFSSPTTAGAAALLLEEDPSRTAEDLAARLTALAEDIGTPGLDSVFGAGKLHLEPAATIDTSAPTITCPADLTIECDQPTGPANTGQATASNECAVTLSYSDVATPLVDCGAVTYLDSGQPIGAAATLDVALGDLDGDGDQDIVFGNVAGELNQVWTNDGTGIYSDSGQTLTSRFTAVAIGDVDGDLDLDVITATSSPLGNVVYINDGAGNFSPGPTLGTAGVQDVEVGDVDGDLDLDVVLIKPGLLPNEVWLNDGAGGYLNSGQALGLNNSFGGALADVDNDNDLDLFVANVGPNRIYLNDGTGIFNDSGQLLGGLSSRDVMLGDLDDDNDIDAFVANIGTNNVWLNDGTGTFSLNQSLPFNIDFDLDMADVDSDGDLDVLIGSITTPNRLWLNDGTATFSVSTQSVGTGFTFSVALGDVDGDSDIDIVVGNTGLDTNEVYFNDDCSQCGDIIARTWTATGCVGKTTSCTQTITLALGVACPADITIECDQSTASANTGTATASDNCDPSPVITQSDALAGSCPTVVTRTWTATDNCGNAANCIQTITLEDTAAPTISCPADITLSCTTTTAPFPAENIVLAAHLPITAIGGGAGIKGNDCWGWTDPLDGREYAIFGRTDGTAFVDVTVPTAPVYLGDLPTHTGTSAWRDMKVFANHVFVVSDNNGTHGMQVFDLTNLRGIVTPQTFSNTAHYAGFASAHNIAINESTGFAYVVGSNTFAGGPHIIDINDPTNPVFAGSFFADGDSHDIQVVTYTGPDATYAGREIAFGSNEDSVSIIDVTNKTTPALLSTAGHPLVGFIHQGWLTDDQRYFIYNDELDELNFATNTTTHVLDVQDLDNPVYVGAYTHPTPSIDHNLYVRGGLVFEANYTAGLRVLALTDIASATLTEIGYLDTHPADDNPTFNGAWSVYPFFQSGTIIISDIEDGMFIASMTPGTGSATASDNCDSAPAITFTDSAVTGSCAQALVITRTWTAADNCSNTANCVQTITIDDTTVPNITCPANVNIDCGTTTALGVTGTATVTDNCDPAPAVTFTDSKVGSCPGTITRTWTAVDTCGNIANCQQIITELAVDPCDPDVTNPAIACPGNVVIECDASTSTASNGAATAIDFCDPATAVTYADAVAAGTCPQAGVITRTWTATDADTNIDTCLQTITILDSVAPVVTPPANVAIACDASTAPAGTGTATATDNCDSTPAISSSDAIASGACPNNYYITRSWTATDSCGNSANADQTITVTDSVAPVISCPANTTIECDQSSAPGTTGTATATDNCDPAPAIGFTDSIAAGSCIGASVITRTWTATDACGNVDSCQQLITTADTEMPLLTTPGNVSVQCADPVSPGDTGNATATDNCDPAPQVMFTDDIVSGTCPYETTITRRWTAEDDCGNTTVGVQTITVLDTTEPLIACPAGVTIECDASTGPGNTGAATATDNCDSNPSFSYSNNSATGACTEESVITRTWMVVDACGNVDGCIQLITRVDTTAPTIAAPADIAIDCDDSTAPSNTGTPIVSDNCNLSPATTFFDSISSNSCNDDYVITRTWTATDGCSNSANDIQTISISDTTAPSVACPGNVSIECDTSSAPGATSTATATDNCDGAPVISHSDATAGSCPTVITRTWTATDSCGNVDSCQQTITLEDNAGPVIGCPADLAIECGMSTDPTSTGQATATDDCTVTTSFSDVTESSVFCLSLSYIDSGQALGAGVTLDTAVGDLDGDGDLDAVHANIAGALNQVWFNDGAGVFTDSGQSFTPGFAVVALGDVDGDLDLDVVTATLSPLGNQIYLNDGTGTLSPGATLGTTAARDLKIGDVDGDNDLDIILIRSGPVPNELWLNDGTGTYTNSGQLLGTSSSIGGALADLDNDNDLDLFVANSGPNRVYLNDGSGTFTDSAQLLGFLSSWNVVLGDIDGDNDVDAFVANVGTNNVWVNDGSGTFTLNQTFPFNIDFDLDMGDVDGDGDLDVVIGSITTPNRVWLNNGTGTFTDSGQLAGSKFTMAVALGDLDGDGDLDITVSNTGMQPNEVFLNEDCDECGSTITRTWTATNCAGNTDACLQTITVEDTTMPVLTCPSNTVILCSQPTDPGTTGTATATDACDTAPTLNFNDSVAGSCPATITRTWTATDSCGNSDNCVQTIDVVP